MKQWMHTLAEHYCRMRSCDDGRPLVILFDIDGTILDMRYIIYNVLRRFDQEHGTDHFSHIAIDDIDFHEAHVNGLLNKLNLPRDHQLRFFYRYEPLFFAMASNPYAYVSFKGVFELIRWFQDRPGTFVGLNTGRPEMLRKDTLVSLNVLGASKGVAFSSDLLFMKPDTWTDSIALLKAEGVRYFYDQGYRVCAFVDNEPENLAAVADMEGSGEILLLHADTIFKSDSCVMPAHAVGGKVYDISTLVNTKGGMKQFTDDDDDFLKRTA